MIDPAGFGPSTEVGFAAAASRHPEAAVATAEVIGAIEERLGGPPSLVVLFASGAMVEPLPEVVDAVQTLLNPDVLVGGTAVGVLAGGEEIEQGDALAAWAATGVRAQPVRLQGLPGPLVAGVPRTLAPGSTLAVLADPYTLAVDALFEQVAADQPSVAIVGGLASAPGGHGSNRLILDDTIYDDGAVGFILEPGVARPVVSQGCRPIGEPWVITEAEGQLVRALGGRPALERLTELIEALPEEDRAAAARGLHAGLVANHHRERFDQGDFLIRAVLGADRNSGAVAIGDRVEIGQVLQFQVRDADSADRELARLLGSEPAEAALVFTCNGRGTHMFAEPHHDAALISEVYGPAVAGMFCAGELGPIADRNAVHGFTATVLAFGGEPAGDHGPPPVSDAPEPT